MAGIYIPNVELPDANHFLAMIVFSDGCACSGAKIVGKAIPVPDHGRLVDADALAAFAESTKEEHPYWRVSGSGMAVILRSQRYAPTIIPADSGKEDTP